MHTTDLPKYNDCGHYWTEPKPESSLIIQKSVYQSGCLKHPFVYQTRAHTRYIHVLYAVAALVYLFTCVIVSGHLCEVQQTN